MSKKLDEILSLRASGHTKRWHTLPHIGQQTVSEHSAQALSLLLILHPNPSVRLIMALLWHDSAERVCGDVPAPIRRERPDLSYAYEMAEASFFDEHPTAGEAILSLDADEQKWLKACDVLELLLWCHDQIQLGNAHARIVAGRARRYLNNPDTPKEISEVVAQLSEENIRSYA